MAPQILKSKDKELPDEIQKYVDTSLVTGKVIWHCNSFLNNPNDENLDLDNSENISFTGVPFIHIGFNTPENQDSQFLSELALHTKGFPLVLTRSYRKNIYKTSPIIKMPAKINTATCDDNLLHESELDNIINKVNMLYCDESLNDDNDSQRSSPGPNDYVSFVSDGSSGFSENLPRLIKPRKRRKKEKKIAKLRYSAGLVTLEPYMPMCFKFPDVNPEENKVIDDDSGLSQSDHSLTNSEEEDSLNAFYRRKYGDEFIIDREILQYDMFLDDGYCTHSKEFETDSTNCKNCEATFLHLNSDAFIFNEVTANQPPQRPWIPLSHPERTRPTAIFTVMCYNVLCDKYATKQLYGYCPSWALNWNYRRKGILDEIRHYGADIISLQEVETEQFYNFFLPELKRDGYDGIFSPKSRAKTMNESERKFVDGCAIFYRIIKFALVKEHLVEFNQLAMANAEGSDDMLNRVMTKDNIGLAALFQTKEGIFENSVIPEGGSKQFIMVCTAHIHWDPEFCDVKLIQTMMLMHELKQIVDDTLRSFRPGASKIDSNAIPLIMCGDLNSLPESGVIEFLTSGRISSNHGDFKELGYKACLSRLSTSEKLNEFTHSFKIARAYENDVMPYTNYTFDFKGIIDYIFYSKQHLIPLGLLGPLDPEWFHENRIVGCPHPHIPSDHFPLLVELELQPSSTVNNVIMARR